MMLRHWRRVEAKVLGDGRYSGQVVKPGGKEVFGGDGCELGGDGWIFEFWFLNFDFGPDRSR
jgi:hypothetical protein